MMTDEEWAIIAKLEPSTRDKVRGWMNARDRNIILHCDRVAAKYQRWIDKELKLYGYGTAQG